MLVRSVLFLAVVGLAVSAGLYSSHEDPGKEGLSWKIVDDETGNFVEFPKSEKYPFGLRVAINKNAEVLGCTRRSDDQNDKVVTELLVLETNGETFSFKLARPPDIPGSENMKRLTQRHKNLNYDEVSPDIPVPYVSSTDLSTHSDEDWMYETPKQYPSKPLRVKKSRKRRVPKASSSSSPLKGPGFNPSPSSPSKTSYYIPETWTDPTKEGLSWTIVNGEPGNFVEFPVSQKYPLGLRVDLNSDSEIIGEQTRPSSSDPSQKIVTQLLVYERYGGAFDFNVDKPLDMPGSEEIKRLAQEGQVDVSGEQQGIDVDESNNEDRSRSQSAISSPRDGFEKALNVGEFESADNEGNKDESVYSGPGELPQVESPKVASPTEMSAKPEGFHDCQSTEMPIDSKLNPEELVKLDSLKDSDDIEEPYFEQQDVKVPTPESPKFVLDESPNVTGSEVVDIEAVDTEENNVPTQDKKHSEVSIEDKTPERSVQVELPFGNDEVLGEQWTTPFEDVIPEGSKTPESVIEDGARDSGHIVQVELPQVTNLDGVYAEPLDTKVEGSSPTHVSHLPETPVLDNDWEEVVQPKSPREFQVVEEDFEKDVPVEVHTPIGDEEASSVFRDKTPESPKSPKFVVDGLPTVTGSDTEPFDTEERSVPTQDKQHSEVSIEDQIPELSELPFGNSKVLDEQWTTPLEGTTSEGDKTPKSIIENDAQDSGQFVQVELPEITDSDGVYAEPFDTKVEGSSPTHVSHLPEMPIPGDNREVVRPNSPREPQIVEGDFEKDVPVEVHTPTVDKERSSVVQGKTRDSRRVQFDLPPVVIPREEFVEPQGMQVQGNVPSHDIPSTEMSMTRNHIPNDMVQVELPSRKESAKVFDERRSVPDEVFIPEGSEPSRPISTRHSPEYTQVELPRVISENHNTQAEERLPRTEASLNRSQNSAGLRQVESPENRRVVFERPNMATEMRNLGNSRQHREMFIDSNQNPREFVRVNRPENESHPANDNLRARQSAGVERSQLQGGQRHIETVTDNRRIDRENGNRLQVETDENLKNEVGNNDIRKDKPMSTQKKDFSRTTGAQFTSTRVVQKVPQAPARQPVAQEVQSSQKPVKHRPILQSLSQQGNGPQRRLESNRVQSEQHIEPTQEDSEVFEKSAHKPTPRRGPALQQEQVVKHNPQQVLPKTGHTVPKSKQLQLETKAQSRQAGRIPVKSIAKAKAKALSLQENAVPSTNMLVDKMNEPNNLPQGARKPKPLGGHQKEAILTENHSSGIPFAPRARPQGVPRKSKPLALSLKDDEFFVGNVELSSLPKVGKVNREQQASLGEKKRPQKIDIQSKAAIVSVEHQPKQKANAKEGIRKGRTSVKTASMPKLQPISRENPLTFPKTDKSVDSAQRVSEPWLKTHEKANSPLLTQPARPIPSVSMSNAYRGASVQVLLFMFSFAIVLL